MREERQILALISSVFIIGIVGLFFTGGLGGGILDLDSKPSKPSVSIGGEIYVEEYRADLYLNGTLLEKYLYQIRRSGQYRMLYRHWKVPLTQEQINRSHVELLAIDPPPGTIAYIKDFKGHVEILNGNYDAASEIQSLAFQNEAGCYRPERFSAGSYEISYLFKIRPPLEYDEEYAHMNLKLADEHTPYKAVTIAIHDPDGLVRRIFPHTPMETRQEGEVWLLTGSSKEDELLEVEILFSPEVLNMMEGFPVFVADIEDKTVSANVKSSGNFFMMLDRLLAIFIIILPAILYLVYRRWGREEFVVVPETLSYLPQKRKPWVVNLVFNGDVFEADTNGFYATLLDLYLRNVIEIERTQGTEEEGLKIRISKDHKEECDKYEKQVLDFLKRHTRDGIFNTILFEIHIDRLVRDAEMGRTKELTRVHEEMKRLMNLVDEETSNEFLNKSPLTHRRLINSTKKMDSISQNFRPNKRHAIHYIFCNFYSFYKIFVWRPLVAHPLQGVDHLYADDPGFHRPIGPLWEVEGGILPGEAGVGFLQKSPIRLCYHPEVRPRGSGDLERMARLWHRPGDRG